MRFNRTAPHRKKKPHREKSIILERKGSWVGSLMWPWEVSGQFLALLGCSALWQIMICRSLAVPQVLILTSSTSSAQMLSCIFLNFVNSQPQIPIDQVLDIDRWPVHSARNILYGCQYLFKCWKCSNAREDGVNRQHLTSESQHQSPSHHVHRAVSPS